jgi:methionyl aminopeptidase
MGLRGRVELKSPEQLRVMRKAGLLTGQALEAVRSAVKPGVTTLELDAIAEDTIRSGGGIPSFKGYSHPPFPATICASVNDEIVHGIPNDRVLVEGDIVSIDCGAIVEGWHGDSAITVPVGGEAAVGADVRELLRATEESLWAGIAALRLGGRVTDVSAAVESYLRGQAHPSGGSWGILEDFTGHGIGSELHMEPNVPNYGRGGRGPKVERGMALAIEPMVTLGSHRWKTYDDEWTIASQDGSWAAHFEHTVAMTAGGAWVLTALDGGEARLAELGLPFGGLS